MLQAIQGDLEVRIRTYVCGIISLVHMIHYLRIQRGQRDFDQKYKGFETQLKQVSEELKVCGMHV